MGDFYDDLAEVLGSATAPVGGVACGAKDRNARCVRELDHKGWHRSKKGVCWPPKASL